MLMFFVGLVIEKVYGVGFCFGYLIDIEYFVFFM